MAKRISLFSALSQLASRGSSKIVVCYVAFILIGANDGAVGVLLPSIQQTYGIDKATLGLLFLAATTGYFIAAFNNGLLMEKLENRVFLLLGTALMALGFGVISARPPFIIVILALLPVGFGVAILDAGLNSYIAGLPRNSALLNYLHAFYGAGALLGPLVASTFLAIGWQWNMVYIAWIGLAAILWLSFGVVFKEHSASQQPVVREKGNILMITLRQRVVWIAAIFLLIYVGTETSLGGWSYSFLTEERHGATLLSGWIVSGYWLGLTIGRLLLGKVALRLGNKRLIQLCLVGVAAGLLLVWLVPVQAVSAFGLFLTGFSLGPIFPTTIALMSQLVSSRVLPGAIGFLASLGSMGSAFFPWLAGNVAQHIGLWSLLPYALILTLFMLLLWLLLQAQPRYRPNTSQPNESQQ